MTPFHALLALFAAGFAGMVAVFHRYYYKPEQEEPINPIPMPEPVQTPEIAPQPAVDKIRIFAMAQQGFEGYYLPGSIHNGIKYPEGSGSFVRKNPGNIKQKNPDGSTSFILFPTYDAGFAALENYIRRVATGKHPAYPLGDKTTIEQYTHIYTGDAEPAPTNYANAIATALGMPTSTPMSYLLT